MSSAGSGQLNSDKFQIGLLEESFNVSGGMSGLLKELYALMTNPHSDFSHQINCFIALGLKELSMQSSIVSRVSNGIYTVISSNVDEPILGASSQLPLTDTLCHHVLETTDPVVFDNPEEIGDRTFYNGQSIAQYIGCKLVMLGKDYGTLCFYGENKRNKPFNGRDFEVLKLIARGVARSIELQSQSPVLSTQTQSAGQFDPSGFSFIKNIPLLEGEGFPREVMECLAKRVGHSQLSIANVAEDMEISTRTLQRRLQLNNINFGELRDHVRYHYAITYLIDQRLSIENIASVLDFSDRTSFTSAFKRWTGLSPSLFRKVYRRYN